MVLEKVEFKMIYYVPALVLKVPVGFGGEKAKADANFLRKAAGSSCSLLYVVSLLETQVSNYFSLLYY